MKYIIYIITLIILIFLLFGIISKFRNIKEYFYISKKNKCKIIVPLTIDPSKTTTTTTTTKKPVITTTKKPVITITKKCNLPYVIIKMDGQNEYCNENIDYSKPCEKDGNCKNLCLFNELPKCSFKECGKKAMHDPECSNYYNYNQLNHSCKCIKKNMVNDNCIDKKSFNGSQIGKITHPYLDSTLHSNKKKNITCMNGSNYVNKCNNSKISNPCGNIICYGDDWCNYTKIKKAKNIICRGKNTCKNADMTKVNANTVTCSGENSCKDAKISNVKTLFCRGKNSCKDAQISKVQTVVCEGKEPNTCFNAQFLDVDEVKCNGGKNVCFNTQYSNVNNKYNIYCNKKNNSCENLMCNEVLFNDIDKYKGKYITKCPSKFIN